MQADIAADRAALVARWYEQGLYGNDTLPKAFTKALPLGGELTFHSETRYGRYTLQDLHARAHALAGALPLTSVARTDLAKPAEK